MQRGQNRFATFAPKPEPNASVVPKEEKKQQKEVKKVVVKPKSARPIEGEEEFENVPDQKWMRQQSGRGGKTRGDHVAGNRRGGGDRRQRDDGDRGDDRGEGRGGGRGGGRGDRGDGENRRGRGRGRGGDGEHGSGGRGRGGGGRQRIRGQGIDDFEEDKHGTTDTAEAGGYRERYSGKAREDWHPMDRASGTGRGRGDRKKQGGGRGDWGDDTKPVEEGEEGKKEEGEDANEESKGKGERRERRGRKEEEKVEASEEEEEVGFTYEDFLAQQQAKNKNLPTAKGRTHEKVEDKNRLEVRDETEKAKTLGIESKIAGRDQHKMTGGSGTELLGFGSVRDDDDFGERRGRGGRGGRGRDDRGPRGGDRGGRGGRRGNRGGNKPVFDEDAFPAL